MLQHDAGTVMASAGTFITGMTTLFKLLPTVVGSLASMAGLVLSVVLIYFKVRNGRLEQKERALKIGIMEQKEKERQDKVNRRKKKGEPVRRSDDAL